MGAVKCSLVVWELRKSVGQFDVALWYVVFFGLPNFLLGYVGCGHYNLFKSLGTPLIQIMLQILIPYFETRLMGYCQRAVFLTCECDKSTISASITTTIQHEVINHQLFRVDKKYPQGLSLCHLKDTSIESRTPLT